MSEPSFGALFTRLFANSPDVIWIWSGDLSNLLYVNPTVEEWLDIDRATLFDAPDAYLEHVLEDDLDRRNAFTEWLTTAADQADQSSEFKSTFRCWGRDGTIRWLEERVHPIIAEDGSVHYWVGIVRDVTTDRELRETLAMQTDQFQLLNQIIRHDIRNEMNLGLDLLRGLRRSIDEPGLEKLGSLMERVVDLTETSRDMTEVIAQLADNPESVEIKPCLQREVATASMLSESATITVEGEIPDIEVETTGLLSAVFRNVLNNAIQHNDTDDPDVEVSVETLEDVVVIHIADNGPGIPDKSKELIFESGKTLTSKGTGFGLALVEKLLMLHGGDIYVWDNTPNGAIFTITLPLE